MGRFEAILNGSESFGAIALCVLVTAIIQMKVKMQLIDEQSE